MLSSFVAATIEVIPKDKPALLSDGNHGADGEYHSFLFPNDNFIHASGLYDDKTGAARGFTDKELSDLKSGNSYIAIFGFIQYADELGRHWLRFCDWHNYVPGTVSNASDCIWMNRSGDGKSLPKGRPSEHANPYQ